jgi:L-ascorbate metabolism protein UlaG (beta-lactamase superfamily)
LALIVPEANRTIAGERMSLSAKRFLGIDEAQTLSAAGFEVTAIPAAHETTERDEWGSLRFVGYVVRCGPWTIYHSGDTVLYDGMVERLSDWRIDVALLPINGRDPARGVAGNLSGREAAGLARQIGATMAIPCHYEMFEFNSASPDEFVAECKRLGQECRVLRSGERWSAA